MKYQQLIEQFWQQYSKEIKAANKIHHLLEQEGEHIVNDHIALRTIDDPRVNIDVLAEPFIDDGYVEKAGYDFPIKKLYAKHFEHPDKDAPKVFISQLLAASFEGWVHDFLIGLIDQIPKEILKDPVKLLFCGTQWSPINYEDYEKLLAASQYAAWFYAYGFRANHFTISLNHMHKYDTVEKINEFLKSNGFALNAENGEIKGTAQDLLEQSSTMAEKIPIEFEDGAHEIPSCYYEFAKRYVDKNGDLFGGFVAASADKIFESTHNKPD